MDNSSLVIVALVIIFTAPLVYLLFYYMAFTMTASIAEPLGRALITTLIALGLSIALLIVMYWWMK